MYLFPKLDQSVPRCGDQFRLHEDGRKVSMLRNSRKWEAPTTYVLMRQPHMINDYLLVRTQPLQNFTILPIPENNVPFPITGRDESSIGREPDSACVSGNSMTSEAFLAVLTESVRRVHEDLVIE